jgi:hypothetical protein
VSHIGHVPLFVEHCEAAAADDVTRRWLDEQGRRELSFSFDALAERHGVPEVACALARFLVAWSAWKPAEPLIIGLVKSPSSVTPCV